MAILGLFFLVVGALVMLSVFGTIVTGLAMVWHRVKSMSVAKAQLELDTQKLHREQIEFAGEEKPAKAKAKATRTKKSAAAVASAAPASDQEVSEQAIFAAVAKFMKENAEYDVSSDSYKVPGDLVDKIGKANRPARAAGQKGKRTSSTTRRRSTASSTKKEESEE